ncbi:MAG: Stk1 family PASTA domain-containing Ser/Thr kinase [Micrococcales bacterium]|nr:Stk1 family PASTA domain-containing Ser/Thr kinase [Micrococcales bacterium]
MSESNKIIAGRYELGELIGRGGMAEVYSGIDTRLGRTVAIKLLKADLAADSSFEIRFRQEAQASARMAHPTIVRVYDAGDEVTRDANGVERHLPYIVMELVRGEVLRDTLRQRRLTQQEAIAYATGVLTALEFSHAAGVIHRDIKPANVMITDSNAVKVMDFGIARAVSDSSATLAHTNGIVGTAQYFSPEQARGETVDMRTDLYSTGVLLYEMLTGRPPFTGETAVSVAYQHVSEQAPTPSSINPSISSAIDSVVMKSLAKERDARFQSASEFRAALVASVNGQSVQSFDDGSQPATAPMQPIDVEELAATVLQPQIPESDLFTELLASANDEATGAINSVPDTTTRVLSEELDGFTQLGFETGSTQVISTNVKPRNSTDKPSAGLLWGFASGAAVLVIGLVVWLLAGGASLINFGGGGASKILVADVIGKTYEDAYTTLTKQKLLVDKQLQLSDTVALGTVISTDPPAGQQVGAKTTITVLVSSGKEQVLMPDLRGLTEQEATVALAAAKLALGTITQADSATVAQNLVISSEPTANQNVAAGTVVNLVISTGMVTVPNVVNLDQNDAISQLSSPQVGYIVESQVDPTCLGTAGTTVIAQSIIPGSQPQLQTIILTLECIN